MMVELTPLADALRAARALIDTPEKWAKGDYEPKPQCYCALGACRKAFFGAAVGPEAWAWGGDINPLADALARALPEEHMTVADFNDDPATTHADVLALFDRAIAAAEAR